MGKGLEPASLGRRCLSQALQEVREDPSGVPGPVLQAEVVEELEDLIPWGERGKEE